MIKKTSTNALRLINRYYEFTGNSLHRHVVLSGVHTGRSKRMLKFSMNHQLQFW